MFKPFIIIIGTLFFILPAGACRPLVNDDCFVIDQGAFQLESGVVSFSQGQTDTQSLATTFTYGLLPNAQFALDLPYSRIMSGSNSADGLGDVNVKTKIQLLEAGEKSLGFSLSIGSKLGNGDAAKGLGNGETDFFANTVLTRLTGFGAVHFNLGYTLTSVFNPVNFGAALEYCFPSEIKVLSELAGSTSPNGPSPLQLNLGINKNISNSVTLDSGIYLGLTDALPNKVFTMGLTALI
jgi:hypothetical protein